VNGHRSSPSAWNVRSSTATTTSDDGGVRSPRIEKRVSIVFSSSERKASVA
jgi:hypothetical protein